MFLQKAFYIWSGRSRSIKNTSPLIDNLQILKFFYEDGKQRQLGGHLIFFARGGLCAFGAFKSA
jgi:hypothetical protein